LALGHPTYLVVAETDRDRWEQFGAWLSNRRIEVGVTKAALARAAGVSLSTVRTLEFGGVMRGDDWIPPAPKNRTLGRLAAALHVSPEELFQRAGRSHAPSDLDDVLDIREKIDLLTSEERGAVEAIVDQWLSERPS